MYTLSQFSMILVHKNVAKFCKMYSESLPSLFGMHGTYSSAQLPQELTENILQNPFTKPAAPYCRKVLKLMFWEVPQADWLIL